MGRNTLLKVENESMNKKDINAIIGQKFSAIGRSWTMAWLGFGQEKVTLDRKGKEVVKSEFALHLQTPWRISDSHVNCLIITSEDMYEPPSTTDFDAFEWEEFNWDIQGGNLYDERVKNMNLAASDIRVLDVTVNDYFDICITFSNGWCLQAFTASSQREIWRFFEPATAKDHFVADSSQID
jgi:hypothetical protein